MGMDEFLWSKTDFDILMMDYLRQKQCQLHQRKFSSCSTECHDALETQLAEIRQFALHRREEALDKPVKRRKAAKENKKPEKKIPFTKMNVTWCIICGKKENKQKLTSCSNCCGAYHLACLTTECTSCPLTEHLKPGCVVWHRMKHSIWWPCEVLDKPPEILSSNPSSMHLPVHFFAENTFCWADRRNMLPFNANSHYLKEGISSNKTLKEAFDQASKNLSSKSGI